VRRVILLALLLVKGAKIRVGRGCSGCVAVGDGGRRAPARTVWMAGIERVSSWIIATMASIVTAVWLRSGVVSTGDIVSV
jgi:hypothetical protein